MQDKKLRPNETEADEPEFKPLTAAEAQALRQRHPPVSPWRVVAGQLVAGVVVAIAAVVFTGRVGAGWSAAWGALSVVVPAALFARGIASPLARTGPAAAVTSFFVWELVKLALTVAMLFAAPRVVPGLSWPALLVGLVVPMKIYWLALAGGVAWFRVGGAGRRV